jgi:alpha-glucosidase
MNDPAVGKIELEEMRFDNARKAHSTYHNQYALGMSQASHAGFLAARPKERPFLLARSGFISTSRYAAVWTGDNHSNRHHLRKSIEVSVNLALSGIPFNGPDVPGFGSDATADLAEDWYKAGFLFPFFRNHSIKGCRRQEPWQFGPQTLGIVRHYIQLRYKLLPYLYNLFIRQETTGEAILRPLFYDFANTPRVNLDKIDDQFLVGPAIMQAPLLGKDDKSRKVVLPTANWFDAQNGKWLRGNRTITVPRGQNSTPLYVREGNLIPMRPGTPTSNDTNLADVELHIFVRPGRRGEYSCEYAFDDGLSFDYRKGKRTEIRFTARAKGSVLEITAEGKNFGFGGCKVRPVVYGTWKKVVFVHRGRRRELALSPYRWLFAGKSISARMATAVRIDA